MLLAKSFKNKRPPKTWLRVSVPLSVSVCLSVCLSLQSDSWWLLSLSPRPRPLSLSSPLSGTFSLFLSGRHFGRPTSSPLCVCVCLFLTSPPVCFLIDSPLPPSSPLCVSFFLSSLPFDRLPSFSPSPVPSLSVCPGCRLVTPSVLSLSSMSFGHPPPPLSALRLSVQYVVWSPLLSPDCLSSMSFGHLFCPLSVCPVCRLITLSVPSLSVCLSVCPSRMSFGHPFYPLSVCLSSMLFVHPPPPVRSPSFCLSSMSFGHPHPTPVPSPSVCQSSMSFGHPPLPLRLSVQSAVMSPCPRCDRIPGLTACVWKN